MMMMMIIIIIIVYAICNLFYCYLCFFLSVSIQTK